MRVSLPAALMAGLLGVASPAWASDPTVLTVKPDGSGPATSYTADQLQSSYSIVTLKTETPWTAKAETITYRGPLLMDVLKQHKLDGDVSIEASAYNEFRSKIKMDEVRQYHPVLAYERACTKPDRDNGRCTPGQEFTRLTLDDSGPFFIVWPQDKLPPSYVPARNAIWVWFVVSIRGVK